MKNLVQISNEEIEKICLAMKRPYGKGHPKLDGELGYLDVNETLVGKLYTYVNNDIDIEFKEVVEKVKYLMSLFIEEISK